MSVNAQRNVRVRTYVDVPPDSRQPIGDFLCAISVSGDASGGTMEATAIAPASIASHFVWHMAGLHAALTPVPGGNTTGRLSQAGGEREYTSQAIVPARYVDLIGMGSGGYASYVVAQLSDWFPISQVQPGLTLTWTFTLDTNGAGKLFVFSVWGHIYDPNVFRRGGVELVF